MRHQEEAVLTRIEKIFDFGPRPAALPAVKAAVLRILREATVDRPTDPSPPWNYWFKKRFAGLYDPEEMHSARASEERKQR